MKQRGFTLIELMVAVVFVLILITWVVNIAGMADGKSSLSFGINGMTEVRCIDGYKFVIGDKGQARQIIDEFGKGAKCESASVPNVR